MKTLREELIKYDKWCETRPTSDYSLTGPELVDKYLSQLKDEQPKEVGNCINCKHEFIPSNKNPCFNCNASETAYALWEPKETASPFDENLNKKG